MFPKGDKDRKTEWLHHPGRCNLIQPVPAQTGKFFLYSVFAGTWFASGFSLPAGMSLGETHNYPLVTIVWVAQRTTVQMGVKPEILPATEA